MGLWITRFDEIKQGFHDLVDDMSAYWNNSAVGKFINSMIKSPKDAAADLGNKIGENTGWFGTFSGKLGVWAQKLFGDNPDPTAPATKMNEERQAEAGWRKVAEVLNRKPVKKDPETKTTVDDYNVPVPAPKVVEEKKDGKPRDGFISAPSQEGIFASLAAAAKNFSTFQFAPAGALGGGAKGNVTVGSHNNTTVNNYVEVKVEGTNATAEDIGQATAQAATQAAVDASDKGTFQ